MQCLARPPHFLTSHARRAGSEGVMHDAESFVCLAHFSLSSPSHRGGTYVDAQGGHDQALEALCRVY